MGTVADAIVARLAQLGVSKVFGYPGETSLSLYAALQREAEVEHVIARCPRSAAYAAEAYARVSGQVGVCDAPGGIGSPYCTPALLEAFNSSTPLVLLTSGPSKSVPKPWATGQVEHVDLFAAVSKRVFVIRSQTGALELLEQAVELALSPRRGPVVVEIAPDVLEAELTPALDEAAPGQESVRVESARFTDSDMAHAVATLKASRRVALIAGGGTHSEGGGAALREFATTFGVPVFTTLNGKGALAESGTLGAPRVVGSKGDSAANAFVSECDVLIYVGSKMGDKSTHQYAWPGPHQYLVRIDNDPRAQALAPQSGLLVNQDVVSGLTSLSDALGNWTYVGARPPAGRGRWSQGSTDVVVHAINAAMKDDDICVGEASVSSGWFGALLTLTPPQRLLTPRGTGSLGYALPASVGAAVSRPHATVWTLVGDGGLAMSVAELETLARNRLRVKVVVLDNGRLNLIDQHAVHHHQAAPVSAAFLPIEWEDVCRGLGIPVMTYDAARQDEAALERFLAADGPHVLVLRTSTEEISPDMAIAIKKGTPA